MRVGQLRHLITIEQLVKAQDSAGGMVEGWQEFTKAWAEIRPIKGDEKFLSNEKYAYTTHHIITRFVEGVEPKMRIVYNNRVLDIVAALDFYEKGKMLNILAVEDLNSEND